MSIEKALIGLLGIAFAISGIAFAANNAAAKAPTSITGTVNDARGRPLPGVVIRLQSENGKTVDITRTDSHGRFLFRAIAPGVYAVIATKRGFPPSSAVVIARSKRPASVALAMASKQPLGLLVAARRQSEVRNAPAPDTGGSVYRFDQDTIGRLPQGTDTPLRQLLLQAPGVSQGTYGQGQEQIHIHGENGGGIQYRINGVFLPEAVSSFGEIMSPRFVQSVNLLTGFMPAEIGYRNEGVIDIHTKEGCIDPGGSIELYGGQRATVQPSFEYGGCDGKLDYYAGGFYLQNDLGVQPATSTPTPVHDHTNQGQMFSYLAYPLGNNARVNLITGTSVNFFQIPPNPDATPGFQLAGVPSYPANSVAESELEQNYFGILTLDGTTGAKLDYRAAYFSRYYRLSFDPDRVGDLIFNGIAARLTHSGLVNGIQADATYRWNTEHTVGAGIYLSGETIELDDHAQVFPANPDGGQKSTSPVSVVDDHNTKAILFGVYVQDEWHLTPKLALNYGVRWDMMNALVGQWQFSPRVGAVYQVAQDTALHAGYARYFQVPPFESVLLGTVGKFERTTGEPSVTAGNQNVNAEQDHFFDAGLAQQLPSQLNLSLDGFFFLAHNKLDLAQFGSTYVFAPLSYRKGSSWGADFSLVRNADALAAYFNFSYVVLQATHISAGQFLAEDPAQVTYIARHWVTLDDNQMFTASAGASYRWRQFLFSADSIWGSGYRRGFANSGTLPPIFQVDAAIARSFEVAGMGEVTGRVAIINVFDHAYEIRNGTGIGVFSPQWGPRRAVYAGLRLSLPSVGYANATSPP